MILRSLVFIFVMVCSVANAEDFASRHITAFGTSTINVVPDQMIWRLKVRNISATSAREAAAHHEALVTAVMKQLKKHSIDESTIQTAGMRLGEVWKRQVMEGYEASTKIDFKLSDFDKYSSIWIGLSSTPAVSVLGVDMGHTELIRYQNEARTSAVLAAQEKAKMMAAAVGMEIGIPLVIEEDLAARGPTGRSFPSISNSVSFSGDSAVVGGYVAPGYIKVVVRVKGVFELLDRP